MPSNEPSKLLTARIIAGAITAGPVMLWIVAWVLVRQGSGGGFLDEVPWEPQTVTYGWWGITLPLFLLGLYFRRRAVAVATGTRVGDDADAAAHALNAIFSQLVVAWALFEGPALLSGVVYLLLADADVMAAGAVVLGVGMYMSFPREAWFEPFQRALERAEPRRGTEGGGP